MRYIQTLFTKAVKEAKRKGFDHIVVAVDLHNTIIRSASFNKKSDQDLLAKVKRSMIGKAVEPLQRMTNNKFIKLMLFSGTKMETLKLIAEIFKNEYGIEFDYINIYKDHEDKNNTQSFQIKPYYSILLDDKAGFHPPVDWESVGWTVKYL